MNRSCAACNVIYMLCLTLWIGVLISAGVSASFAFTTLPDLGISLESYSSYLPNDLTAHGRIAAGHMLEEVFTFSDFSQIALSFVVAVTMILQFTVFREKIRTVPNLLRCGCICIAILLLASHVFLQAPVMNRELRLYWQAAQAGDEATATIHRKQFETYHQKAELVLKSNLFLLLIATGASAARRLPTPPPQVSKSTLEQPQLLKG